MPRDYAHLFEEGAELFRIDQHGYVTLYLNGVRYETLKAMDPPYRDKAWALWKHKNTNQIVTFLKDYELHRADEPVRTRDADLLKLIKRMKEGPPKK